jgi:hypothetical protein
MRTFPLFLIFVACGGPAFETGPETFELPLIEAGSHDGNSEVDSGIDAVGTGTLDSGTRDSDSQDSGTRDSDSQDSGTRDSDSQDSGTRDSDTRDSETRDSDSQDSETLDSDTPDTVTVDSATVDTGTDSACSLGCVVKSPQSCVSEWGNTLSYTCGDASCSVGGNCEVIVTPYIGCTGTYTCLQ